MLMMKGIVKKYRWYNSSIAYTLKENKMETSSLTRKEDNGPDEVLWIGSNYSNEMLQL